MTRIDLAPLGRLRPMRAVLLGTVCAIALATAAAAETLTVSGIETASSGLYTVEVPSVEVVDGNVTEAEVRTLFTGSLQALADLDAASVTIPELKVTYPSGTPDGGTTTVTYRDLVLTDVVDGVAASAILGGADFGGPENLTGNFGEMAITDFDVGGMLAFYGLVTSPAPAADGEFREVYSGFTFAGGELAVEGMLNCTFGAGDGGAFSARPLRTNMAEIQPLLLEMQAAETSGTPPDPEKIKKVVLFYTDILTAFTNSPSEFEGFSCAGKDDKGQAFSIASGPVTAGGFEPGIYPDFAINDLDIVVEGSEAGHVKLGNFTWKKMDFNTAIEVLEAATVMDEAFFAANWRKLVPAMDGFSVAGLDIDVPNPEAPAQRSVGTLGSFDATLGNYTNGIPADIALKLVNLVIPITEDMKDLPIAELKARGITTLDISLGTDLAWDKATSTIKVDEVLMDLGSLGKINLSGTFGNATEALFAENTDQAMLAAMGVTLKDVTISIEDRGIGSFLVASGAKEAGQSEQSFRTAVAGMAQGMTLAFLGNSAEALTAAQQLGLFLQGASSLEMTITAKDPAGIGLADLAAAEKDPTALAGKLTVVATASGEPVTLPLVDEAGTVQDQKRDLKAPATTN